MPSIVRGLFREDRRRMERRTNRHHQLEAFRDGGERGGRGPGVERRRVDALDVVEQQLGDERQVVADLLAAARETLHVRPRRVHLLVVDVAEPAAEDRQPVAVSHRPASAKHAGAALDVVDEVHPRIEADDPLGVGDEVRQRVDVVEVGLAVAIVDEVLDAADVEMTGAGDGLDLFDDFARRIRRRHAEAGLRRVHGAGAADQLDA